MSTARANTNTPAEAGFALIEAHRGGATKLTRKAASFCGELVVDPAPLTQRQAEWLATLLSRANLPPLAETES